MIVAALAPLLFVSLAQASLPEYQPVQDYPEGQEAWEVDEPDPGEAYPEEEEANGFDDGAAEQPAPVDGAEDAGEPVEPVADEADEDSAEAEEDLVCRRVHYTDDFGRHRSRKSCRPR